MELRHRCIDRFGYCNSPKTPETRNTERRDGYPNYFVLTNCKFNPETCPHYQTFTQTLASVGHGADGHTA